MLVQNTGDGGQVIENTTPWCNGLNEKSLPGSFVNGRSTDLACYNRVTGIGKNHGHRQPQIFTYFSTCMNPIVPFTFNFFAKKQ